MDNKSLIRLLKENLNEFVKYLDKNGLSQDPNDKAYFVSSEGIKLPFLLVADLWRKEKENLEATR